MCNDCLGFSPYPVILVDEVHARMVAEWFNNGWIQERHSTARFNANCYRRLAYKNMLQAPQLKLHEEKQFGAFYAEKILGCPALFSGVERFRDFMEDHVYVSGNREA